MRAALVLAVCASLAAATPAAAADRVLERGIVQSIDGRSVVLRALDGTAIGVALGPATRYRLNGRAATRSAIRSGFVAEAVTVGGGPALVVRAFGALELAVERGTLVRRGTGTLVLLRPDGTIARVSLTAATTITRAGVVLRARALRRGMRLEVVLAPTGGAATVRVLRRR